MITDEALVQRFLDQELAPEERIHVLARVGRDSTLRDRVIELEQLVLDASRLPRPAVPPAFVTRVLERLEPAPPVWRRFAAAFLAPRELRWNLAGATAAAGVASLAVWAAIGGGPAVRSTSSASDTVLVRLVVLQPGATAVQVAGDFNGWNPAETPLRELSDGAWAVTLPLEPGRYEYQFVVNGKEWIADPFAAEQSDDGFGSRNAVLEVWSPREYRETL